MNEIKIGIAKKDISPSKSVCGRLGINHMIEPHDSIMAKAITFMDNNITVINISCEVVGLTTSTINKIKDIIVKSISIERKNIIILGTHTHSSPWVWDIQSKAAEKFGFDLLDEQWINKVINQTALAGINSYKDLSKGELFYGDAVTTGIVSNRVYPVTRWSVCYDDNIRNQDVGLVDANVRVVIAKNKNKMVFLANLACHPTALGGGITKKVSPDFPFYAEKILKDKYDIEFLTYWQGCAGNSNGGKFIKYGNMEEALTIAKNFAKAIDKAVTNKHSIESNIEYKHQSLKIPVGKFIKSEKEARKDFEKISKEVLETKKAGKEITYQLVYDWRAELKKLDISILSNGVEIPVELQLLQIGKFSLLFVPGEWYIENYFQIKNTLHNDNIIITTLNTFDVLYVPDESNFDKHDWYGVKTSMRALGDEGVKILISESIKLLRK